jgi:hypothetical protein
MTALLRAFDGEISPRMSTCVYCCCVAMRSRPAWVTAVGPQMFAACDPSEIKLQLQTRGSDNDNRCDYGAALH